MDAYSLYPTKEGDSITHKLQKYGETMNRSTGEIALELILCTVGWSRVVTCVPLRRAIKLVPSQRIGEDTMNGEAA